MRGGAGQRRPSTESFSDCEANPLPKCSFFLLFILMVRFGMRTIVQVRRVLYKVYSAPSSSSLARTCWWIPAGGEPLLCYSFCRCSRFLGYSLVPRCLVWVRFVHGSLVQGPAGGRRLALMASSSFSRSSVARCCSKLFPRYVVARGFWGLEPVFLLVSGLPCGSSCRLWVCPGCAVSGSCLDSFTY